MKWLASPEGEIPEAEVKTLLGFKAGSVPDEDEVGAGAKDDPQTRRQSLRKMSRHYSAYVGS